MHRRTRAGHHQRSAGLSSILPTRLGGRRRRMVLSLSGLQSQTTACAVSRLSDVSACLMSEKLAMACTWPTKTRNRFRSGPPMLAPLAIQTTVGFFSPTGCEGREDLVAEIGVERLPADRLD